MFNQSEDGDKTPSLPRSPNYNSGQSEFNYSFQSRTPSLPKTPQSVRSNNGGDSQLSQYGDEAHGIRLPSSGWSIPASLVTITNNQRNLNLPYHSQHIAPITRMGLSQPQIPLHAERFSQAIVMDSDQNDGQSSQAELNKEGHIIKKRYMPSQELREGPGARSTKNSKKTQTYFNEDITALFEEKRKMGLYLGSRFIGTHNELVTLDHTMWVECIGKMKVPDHIHLNQRLWGNRTGSLNVKKQRTYNMPNIFHIPTTILNNSGAVLMNEIYKQNKVLKASPEGHKLCLFLVTSQVYTEKNIVNDKTLHTNILISACDQHQKISFFVFEPQIRQKLYRPIHFLFTLREELRNYDDFKVIFGTQNGTYDCLHKCIDWVAKVVAGFIDWEDYDLIEFSKFTKDHTIELPSIESM